MGFLLVWQHDGEEKSLIAADHAIENGLLSKSRLAAVAC